MRTQTPEAVLWALIRRTNDVSQREIGRWVRRIVHSFSQSNKVKKCSKKVWSRERELCQIDKCGSRSHCGSGGVGGHQITAEQRPTLSYTMNNLSLSHTHTRCFFCRHVLFRRVSVIMVTSWGHRRKWKKRLHLVHCCIYFLPSHRSCSSLQISHYTVWINSDEFAEYIAVLIIGCVVCGAKC